MKLLQRWKQTALHNKALVWTSVLVAFGTLFYAATAVYQVCLMKSNAAASEKQVERLVEATNDAITKATDAGTTSLNAALSQNRDALNSALAQAKDSLDAGTKQSKAALDASIAAANNTLRPYVYVATLALLGTLREGQRMQGEGGVINSGRTPAIRTAVCADLVILGNADTLGDDYPCPSPRNPPGAGSPTHSIAVIGPNSPPVFVRSPGTTVTAPANRPPGVFDRLMSSGVLRLYFYGDITYSELLNPKIVHHSQFCGVYEPTSRDFNVCDHHTNVD